jgi:hypothetical protein
MRMFGRNGNQSAFKLVSCLGIFIVVMTKSVFLKHTMTRSVIASLPVGNLESALKNEICVLQPENVH